MQQAPASYILRAEHNCDLHFCDDSELASARFSARLPGSVDALAPCLGELAVVHTQAEKISKAWDTLLETAQRCREGDDWARPQLRGFFTSVLALTLQDGFELGQWSWQDPDRPAWLDAVLLAMESRLHESTLDVSYLAELAHLSPSRFAHSFCDVLGVPPKRHLLHLRLQRAQTLLADPLQSVKTIASREVIHFVGSQPLISPANFVA
jgi:AraC-like DNA-binding protein